MSAQTTAQSRLKQVLSLGQSLWYDGLLPVSEFGKLIEQDGIRGATTNPAIFEKEISSGQYDSQIRGFAADVSEEEIFKSLAIKTVQDVCDLFKPIYEESNGEDGYVSIEVSPLLANSQYQTVEEAQELWKRVNRKNVMIKIPATKAGVKAIESVIAEGINVNVTLIFSVERYRQVMNAYLAGLEARTIEKKSVSQIASVASFFISRVDSAIDPLLKDASLKGKIAIDNSRVAYEEFKRYFQTPRYSKLEMFGARLQRPLWASTGTKNPAYSDVLYVETLIGPNTVNTMPPATLDAFRDHGNAADRISEDLEGAHERLEKLNESGINLLKITEDLEKAGVQQFVDAHNKIISAIKGKRT